MAPDTAELIDNIDEERRETRRLLQLAEERLREAERISRRLEKSQREARVEREAAAATLRRAGLLASR